jgi:hypothetical protein
MCYRQTWRIIIIGKTELFDPQPSLKDCARFYSGFTSLNFATVIFLQSKVVSLASNPQPSGPGPCIYVTQWQGGPVIPLGTGFHFRSLLPLEGLRWRYSNPPPHGEIVKDGFRNSPRCLYANGGILPSHRTRRPPSTSLATRSLWKTSHFEDYGLLCRNAV